MCLFFVKIEVVHYYLDEHKTCILIMMNNPAQSNANSDIDYQDSKSIKNNYI